MQQISHGLTWLWTPSGLKIHRVSTKSLLRVVFPLQAQIVIECPTNFMRFLDNEANPILEHMLAPLVTIRLDFRLHYSRVSIKPNGYLFSAIQNHFQTHFMVECPEKNNRGRSRLYGNRARIVPSRKLSRKKLRRNFLFHAIRIVKRYDF